MRRGTDAGVGVVDLRAIGLDVAKQFGEVLGRQVCPRHDRHRHIDDQRQ
jgi:hypothetical protein